ncbi:u2 snrnp auxiliary splicing factor u2af large subunit [Vairimorpha apis BRL 01]|uniref:U2 snrnp auxiliary splicing factor u2af large subunit n=1 Tax=Vairimorpha apis BRL 01 TaxID=1037528 RepID=T0LC58_9MICR|nr:u2 snrnp auxiliary splicing factor u2af large subunit [Vairimorpha apis BRL 01]
MIKRKRKSTTKEYEKNNFFCLQYLQDIMESKIKFINNYNDDLEVFNKLSKISISTISHKVNCSTDLSYQEFKNYVLSFGPCTLVPKENKTCEIYFTNIEDANVCAISSTKNIKFTKSSIELSKNQLLEKIKNFDGILNKNLPLDYDTILIGPLDIELNEFSHIINKISPLFGIVKIGKYFKILFLDSKITKRFVNIISNVKIDSKSNFMVKYAYINCKINFYPPFVKVPFISFILNSRIVFLLNSKYTENEIYNLCKNNILAILFKQDKTIIECENIEDGINVHNFFGGMIYKEKIIISGFYPEFNYIIGDY